MKDPDRTYWYIGDRNIFRLSKDRCQRLIHALLVCNGRIHDSQTFSLDHKTGKLLDGIPVGKADAIFSISIKKGTEDLFCEIISDPNCLEEPIKVQVN
jgi:hypothetical protein